MARRPVFVPDSTHLVEEVELHFEWFPGFAAVQKQKSIRSLHASAKQSLGPSVSLLEVSSKSEQQLGSQLSAFNLRVEHFEHGSILLEAAFQRSKVFAGSGQHEDLYRIPDGREVKKRIRELARGQLECFRYEHHEWQLVPQTAFYDWLYLSAVRAAVQDAPDGLDELLACDAFSDIEFNPDKSINCQARSCALLVSLHRMGETAVVDDPDRFIQLLTSYGYGVPPAEYEPGSLF
jgi:hypothetical protein